MSAKCCEEFGIFLPRPPFSAPLSPYPDFSIVMSALPRLAIDRLQPGVFISLGDLGWIHHPFLLNAFRIASDKQIQVLHGLGLTEVTWDPARSTAEPLPATARGETGAGAGTGEEDMDFAAAALAGMLDEKQRRIERVRAQRDVFARREREYESEAASIADILRTFAARPADAHGDASALVGRVVDGLMDAPSVAIHLVNQKSRDSGLAFHSLNVMVLTLLLGKAVGLSADEMRQAGLGALLHDAGKSEIPPRILRTPQRTPPEEEFYRAHIGYGIKAVAGARNLSVAAKNVIACHHERWDGTGFPNKLAGERIPRLARVVAIANRYDNLCNPYDVKRALTPAEALAQLFKKEAAHFDPDLLQRFIKTMGVYPPGSFVALSNGATGLVIETDPARLLSPTVMLHDAEIPRSEALVVDLKEAELAIEAVVSPAGLPLSVVEYLAPRGRVDYYVEGSA